MPKTELLTASNIGGKLFSLFFIWRLSKKPMHGYALLSELQEISQRRWSAASVYVILHKLEKRGLIKSRKSRVNNRVRKVFETTAKGKKLFLSVRHKHTHGLMHEFHRALSA